MQARKLFAILAIAASFSASPTLLQAGDSGSLPPQPCRSGSLLSSPLVTGLYVSSLIL